MISGPAYSEVGAVVEASAERDYRAAPPLRLWGL